MGDTRKIGLEYRGYNHLEIESPMRTGIKAVCQLDKGGYINGLFG